MNAELAALKAIDFDWTRHLDSVWNDGASHSKELNGALADDLTDYLLGSTEPGGNSPLGRVIIGAAGAGKTHLIGELRRQVWQKQGWFVLLDLADVNDFWPSAALSYLQSLQRTFNGGITQGDEILLRLCAKIPAIAAVLKSKFSLIFSGEGKEIVKLADAIVDALRHDYRTQTQQHRATIKAFVVFQSRDSSFSDSAYSWLQGVDVEGSPFGPTIGPRNVIRGLSWLMSLTGPTLLVVDQIDAIVAVHNHALAASTDSDDAEHQKALKIIDELAGGLMDLHGLTRRTVTLLSSLEATWEVLKTRAIAPAKDRFRNPDYIRPLGNGKAAEAIVTARLQVAYATRNFKPPYPSWPYRKSAFDGTVGMLPRELLRHCDTHRQRCLTDGYVTELASFDAKVPAGTTPPPSTAVEEGFLKLCKAAPLPDFLDPDTGEKLFPELLLDALRSYVLQTVIPDDVDLVVESDPSRRRPALHARLRRIYRSEGDREEHHCFRAIPHTNAIAFQSRLKAAITAAGIDMSLPFRHLLVIRRDASPGGAKTQQLCQEFKNAGGKFVSLSDDDLRTMVALQTMLKEHPEGFESWLKQRKPLCDIAMFRDAGLCGGHTDEAPSPANRQPASTPKPEATHSGPTTKTQPEESKRPSSAKGTVPDSPASIFIGRRLIGGKPEQPRYLALDLLPRHTAILAGSGSGKTVLLRRMIEEAALQGVPAIVLDTNNDLARLGDSWPETPAVWDEADRDKAKRYTAKVEVVVWTPGIAGGKPITLAPMPDFAPVRGDEDELQQTVAMAHAALKPLIGATGAKANLKEGILMQALRYFAPSDQEGLDAFVRLLSDLPQEVSDIGNAHKLAGEMADHFKAEIAKNPLLSFKGTPLDPKALFTAKDKSKTRVSVINFSGLPADDAKQSFVNQLEMTLFSWIKKNPTPGGRPLTGLLVMDEAQNFAPAQKSTPCKESTIALVAQARKYGLGMIFATQVPKNIDNKIISNCTTHFYGKMNAPATIDAVQELMAAKGGGGSDIGSLKAGAFYFTTEGMPVAEKVKTPLCLSHHPQNPLPQEEVVKRAKASI